MSGVPVGKHSLAEGLTPGVPFGACTPRPDGDAGSFLKIEIAESVETLKSRLST